MLKTVGLDDQRLADPCCQSVIVDSGSEGAVCFSGGWLSLIRDYQKGS